jgi:hypothetical protein
LILIDPAQTPDFDYLAATSIMPRRQENRKQHSQDTEGPLVKRNWFITGIFDGRL